VLGQGEGPLMAWLISYQMQACYRVSGGVSRNAPLDVIEVVADGPAQLVLRAKKAVRELEAAPFDPMRGLQRAERRPDHLLGILHGAPRS
jgi:hypothetical protein